MEVNGKHVNGREWALWTVNGAESVMMNGGEWQMGK
jgi:hypothetical protein